MMRQTLIRTVRLGVTRRSSGFRRRLTPPGNSMTLHSSSAASVVVLRLHPTLTYHRSAASLLLTRRWMSNNEISKEVKESRNVKPLGGSEGESPRSSSTTTATSPPTPSGAAVAAAAYVGDQLSVVAIAVLTALLVLAPSMIQRIRERGDSYDFFSIDDPIDDLTKELYRLAEEEERLTVDEHGGDVHKDTEIKGGESKQNVVEHLLRDVFQSQALQQAAQQFVSSTLQSETVRLAFQRLLKELAMDLLQDPETVAQVIKLLHFAIQNKQVRDAAQDLVLDIVNDPDVREALVSVIQRLGREPAVQQATQTLLSESTHAVLNDEDVLDHSMEFATDVLGDDIVQQTAGEALRNTVGHAVRPAATTAVWVAAGISWIAVAFLALGYANNESSAGRLIHSASLSINESRLANLPATVMGLILWPIQLLIKVVWMPIEFLGTSIISVTIGTMQWLASLPERALKSAYTTVQVLGNNLSQSTLSLLAAAASAAFGILQSTWAYCASIVFESSTCFAQTVLQSASRVASLAQKALEKHGGSLYSSLLLWLAQTTEHINDLLTQWAFWVEHVIFSPDDHNRNHNHLSAKTNGHA